jgi:hypothetical protein
MKAKKNSYASSKKKQYKEGGKSDKKVMIDAPKGYHWMDVKGRFYLMPHEGKFVPHEGASLKAPFKVITQHSK